MPRPLYALCDSPQRLSLLSATMLGDGFTHILAASPPVRHKMAVSPYRALGSQACQHSPVFSDSTAILVRKPATLWLKPPPRGPVPWQGCYSAPFQVLPIVSR